jgi:hypothetical protein
MARLRIDKPVTHVVLTSSGPRLIAKPTQRPPAQAAGLDQATESKTVPSTVTASTLMVEPSIVTRRSPKKFAEAFC